VPTSRTFDPLASMALLGTNFGSRRLVVRLARRVECGADATLRPELGLSPFHVKPPSRSSDHCESPWSSIRLR
jgi:hypothetical protein